MKDKLELNSNAIKIRRDIFNEDAFSSIDIFVLISNLDEFTVVFYPMSDRISGMCIREKNGNVIGINSALSYGRQRFCAAHELYHVFFEKGFRIIGKGEAAAIALAKVREGIIASNNMKDVYKYVEKY